MRGASDVGLLMRIDLFDPSSNVFHSPCRGAWPKFHWFREAPRFDTIPPGGFANWDYGRDGRIGIGVADYLSYAEIARFGKLIRHDVTPY